MTLPERVTSTGRVQEAEPVDEDVRPGPASTKEKGISHGTQEKTDRCRLRAGPGRHGTGGRPDGRRTGHDRNSSKD
ncbi:hypothetical protein CITRIK5_30165 [Citricoccus sp. K5]|nr:hypothetical protein CITRIK5_30165 [Citricoccus sp. K5]